jgi:hypothetical protein
MFSTTDSADRRALTIVVSAPDRSEMLILPDALQETARRAAAFPDDRQLRILARGLIDRERRNHRHADAVRIRCWRTVFDRETLLAARQLIRDYTYEDRRDGLLPWERGNPEDRRR